MSEALRPTGVHKIGGKNLRKLDEVRALIEHLKTTRECIVLVVSAFTGVTNALIKALDNLHEAVRWLHRIFVDGDPRAIKQYLDSHAQRLAASTTTYKP